MTHEEWLASTDPEAIWRLYPPMSDRKVRLWVSGCCRIMLNPRARTPWYERYANWFAPAQWLPNLEAAEDYADGLIDQQALRERRDLKSGGPHNVLKTVAGIKSFSHAEAIRRVGRCSGEFGSPSRAEMRGLIRDVFGNPFRPAALDAAWRTSPTVGLARSMYESRNFGTMPILADALEEAGCNNPDMLTHCREPGNHVRGCWVVDLVLGKS
jgi:hypothetical protein